MKRETFERRAGALAAAAVIAAAVALVGCAPTETKAPGVIPTSPPTAAADETTTASAS